MFLHSEVLRYSSSAIRPLFEYLFIQKSGYDLIRIIYITYVTVVFTIYAYMQWDAIKNLIGVE